MRDHKRLRAFELADEAVTEVYRATAGFPREEQFGLTAQIRRSAVSVPSNIVEGCARHSQSEYMRFLGFAFGSLRELRCQIDLSHRLGFMDNPAFSKVDAVLEETEKVLGGLIHSLRREERVREPGETYDVEDGFRTRSPIAYPPMAYSPHHEEVL